MFIRGMYVPKSICLFFEGEGGGGGGTPAAIPDASADLARRLAAAEGSASVVAQQLSNENYQLRVSERNKGDEIARLKAENAQLKTTQPAEGAVVLSKEDAATFEALKALGKPDEIKTKLESIPTLEQKIAGIEREKVIAKAADLEGYKDAEVLASLIGDSAIEFKQVDVAGKKQDAPFIKLTENGVEKIVRLSEHIEAAHAKFLPVLKPATSTPNQTHVKQTPAGPQGGTDVYQKIRDRKKQEREAKKSTDKPLSERLNLAKSA